jgi:diguanylate cyclase (GGDEF)-like protein
MRILLAITCSILFFVSAALGQSVIPIQDLADQKDFTNLGQIITVDKVEIAIAKPDNPSRIINLKALGSGPKFFWTVYTFANGAAQSKTIIVSLDHRGLVNSASVPLTALGSPVIQIMSDDPEVPVIKRTTYGQDSFHVTIPANANITIALQTTASQPNVFLQGSVNDDAQSLMQSAIIGAILICAILLPGIVLVLYYYRATPAILSAVFLGLASLLFIAMELGVLTPSLEALNVPLTNSIMLRGLIEGLMTSAIFFCIYTFGEVTELHPQWRQTLLGLAIISLSLPAFSFVEPAWVIAITRPLFAAGVIAGFALTGAQRHVERASSRTIVLVWSALLAWVLLAFTAMLWPFQSAIFTKLVCIGLIVAIAVLAAHLIRSIFGQPFLMRRFFSDAGRRSLALTAAHQHIWDWSPIEQFLTVSPELWTVLGYELPTNQNDQKAFLNIIHPADLAPYLSHTDNPAQHSEAYTTLTCRLRHADATYRWYTLRASIIENDSHNAARIIGTLSDITEVKQTEQRLLQSSLIDVVTGLPNRALFEDRLVQALARKSSDKLQVILLELENLKNINEAFDHEIGDRLLLVTSQRIAAHLQPTDTLGRISGDQFAVLCLDSDQPRDINALAKTLAATIAEPLELAQQEIFLAANIGVSPIADDKTNAEQILKEAGIALYEAKREGERRVRTYVKSMRDDRHAEIILDGELRRATDRGELQVHYQPIARLDTMELVGFEALVRWQHPRLGLLGPDRFISLAEQTGTILEIGRFVLFEAAKQLAIWQRIRRSGNPVFMAVNVSAVQLVDVNLIADIGQVLQRENIPPDTFKIEVTESVVMQFPERAAKVLQNLRGLGIGLSCDDFGTGHSSLSNLRDLPFTTLKIDRSFIATKPDDHRAEDILAAIVDLAHRLGLSIVAEGIETQHQLDNLQLLSCDFGQGYLIGIPLTASQVSAALGTAAINPNQSATTKELLPPEAQ